MEDLYSNVLQSIQFLYIFYRCAMKKFNFYRKYSPVPCSFTNPFFKCKTPNMEIDVILIGCHKNIADVHCRRVGHWCSVPSLPASSKRKMMGVNRPHGKRRNSLTISRESRHLVSSHDMSHDVPGHAVLGVPTCCYSYAPHLTH